MGDHTNLFKNTRGTVDPCVLTWRVVEGQLLNEQNASCRALYSTVPIGVSKRSIGMDIVLEDEIEGGHLWRVKHKRGEEEGVHSFPSVLLGFCTTSMD